jgi:hypothetical protein
VTWLEGEAHGSRARQHTLFGESTGLAMSENGASNANREISGEGVADWWAIVVLIAASGGMIVAGVTE